MEVSDLQKWREKTPKSWRTLYILGTCHATLSSVQQQHHVKLLAKLREIDRHFCSLSGNKKYISKGYTFKLSGNKEWTGTPRRELYFMYIKNNKLMAYRMLAPVPTFQGRSPSLESPSTMTFSTHSGTSLQWTAPVHHVLMSGKETLVRFFVGKWYHSVTKLFTFPTYRERTKDL